VRPQRLAQQRTRQQRLRQVAVLGLPPLLDDKLRVPRATLAVLRRRRVIELIDAAAAHRVTLVSGPAGAGKTVACASWAATRSAARQPAWLTVDAEDREPARFWQYVLAALVQAGAVAADDASQLAGAPPEAYPLRIVAAARSLAEPVVLVIDDVHELAGSGALAGLDLLIRHAPPGLRLILSGRCPPGLALARLRVAGELADIDAADLACTTAEADAYLAMLDIAMTPARRDELLHRTEGWMAGLRLAAMASHAGAAASDGVDGGASGAAGGVGGGAAGRVGGVAGGVAGGVVGGVVGSTAGGTEAVVIDYVCDEVLDRQSPDTRQFMLRTSVAASMCGDLADALTGERGTGARTLERLARENSMVEPVGTGHAEYRYHPMLREVLAVELSRELPQEVPALLGRAARWHAARGHAIDAVRAAAQAGDWDFGAQVLAETGAGVLAEAGAGVPGEAGAGVLAEAGAGVPGEPGAGVQAELEAVLAAFPADRRTDDAPVAAAMAAARLWQGDAAGAAPHLACAQRSLARLDPDARRAVEPWLAALQVMRDASQAAPGPGEPGGLARHWSQAEQAEAGAVAVPEYRAAGVLWFALGCARLRRWEIGAARYALARASSQLAAGSLPGMRARAIAWQALAAARYGDLAAADRLMAEAAIGPAGRRPAVACPCALAGAQVSVARDEIDAARRLLDEADRNSGGELAGEPSVAVISGLIRAHCAAAESDTAAARSILLRLRAAHAADDQPLSEVLAALEAGIALAAGEREQASLVLGGDPATLRAARPEGQLCHARLLLAAGDDAGALQVAEACRNGSAQDVTLRDRVAALLITAVAQRRLGRVAEAAQAVEQALALAEPGGACRVFLDGGPAVRSAMTVLVPPTSRCAGFAGRILERFDGQLPRPAGAASQAELPLTASELAVLRFLPSHMTNQEIAEALFLSINTVKTHLRSAYRKLGVANRRQAIARGRRLELL
jgi:LuxR family maltose regulon positive regulatory protein